MKPGLRPPRLGDVLSRLKALYGAPKPPASDPVELILRENAAYLVDDETREAVFRSLKGAVGVTPEAILAAAFGRIVAAIRAEKPRERVAAHQLLRRHGQELCKRSEPRCDVCPLASVCVFHLTRTSM